MRVKIENIILEVNEESIADESFRSVLVERLNNGEWESEEASYVSIMPSDSVVLELGACIGFISCLVNSKLDDRKKHVVLEANTNLISTLKNNKEINFSEFSIENKILSATSGFANFYVDKRSILGSSLVGVPMNRIKEEILIEKTTLDSLERNYGFIFDALICDIEGGEYELFENVFLDETLKKFRFLSIEFHWNEKNARRRCDAIINRLSNLGFDLTINRAKTGQIQLFGLKNGEKNELY